MCARLTEKLKGKIKALIELKWSYHQIMNHFMFKKMRVYSRDISKLVKEEKNGSPIAKKPETRGRSKVLTVVQRYRLRNQLLKVNPPTQRYLAKLYKVSQSTISSYVKKLDLKKYSKPRNHKLNAQAVEKRRVRSLPLYRKLCGGRYKDFVTSDEALMYISDADGNRKIVVRFEHTKAK